VTESVPAFNQLNLVVRDMQATLEFYRRLGVPIADNATGPHVNVELPNGVSLEFDETSFVPQWDSSWRGATGGSTILGFALPSREGVDELFGELVAAGYHGRQRPYDAFWGARYAIVDDPDGNGVGLMSPVDKEKRVWPPPGPPPR
jgi:catechol 2,3-dioxygenase-like lactoylglutathione lyase family enzyme